MREKGVFMAGIITSNKSCQFHNEYSIACGMHYKKFLLPLLGGRKMTRQDKEKHSISIALIALRIRKKLFHHIFCSHPVEQSYEIFLSLFFEKYLSKNCF